MANVNELRALFPTLVKVLEDYGRNLVKNYRQGLKDGDHVATGNLYRSVQSEVTVNNSSFIVEFRMPEYGEFLEQGTKPHWPPTSAILSWIRAKRIVPKRDQQGRLPTEKQLSYLIARKISEDGTQRTGIYETANALTANQFNTLIDKAIQTDLENNVLDIIRVLGNKGKVR